MDAVTLTSPRFFAEQESISHSPRSVHNRNSIGNGERHGSRNRRFLQVGSIVHRIGGQCHGIRDNTMGRTVHTFHHGMIGQSVAKNIASRLIVGNAKFHTSRFLNAGIDIVNRILNRLFRSCHGMAVVFKIARIKGIFGCHTEGFVSIRYIGTRRRNRVINDFLQSSSVGRNGSGSSKGLGKRS